jgi:hypothetical protein
MPNDQPPSARDPGEFHAAGAGSLDSLQPPLWLHGHSTVAAVPALSLDVRSTRMVNVTGAVLVELVPPAT